MPLILGIRASPLLQDRAAWRQRLKRIALPHSWPSAHIAYQEGGGSRSYPQRPHPALGKYEAHAIVQRYRHLSTNDETKGHADIIYHLPSDDLDLLVLVAHAFLKSHANVVALACNEEVIDMHKHRDFPIILTLLVEYAWLIIRDGDEFVASHSGT